MSSAVSTVTFLAYLLGSNAHHAATPLTLSSSAFPDQGVIPVVYTCRGQNAMIPLSWQGQPLATRSYALIMSDPNVRGAPWYNWEIYNIPAQMHSLSAEQTRNYHNDHFAVNSRLHAHYDGPCPAFGRHHYVITLYALDTRLTFDHPVTAPELLKAMRGHVVGTAKLAGEYPKATPQPL